MATPNKKRGYLKRRLSEFNKYVTELETSCEIQGYAIELRKRLELEQRLTRMSACISEFYEINPDCGEEEECAAAQADFENQYFDVDARARVILTNANKLELPPPVAQPVVLSEALAKMKLPTIALPKFDGNSTKWLEFRDAFEAMIHSASHVPDVNKFHYLKAALMGDAASIIQSMEMSAENYQIAWGLLCERHSNRRLLIQNHVQALFEVSKFNGESAQQYRGAIDHVNKHLRALKALDQPVEHWDTLIVFLVAKRFDKNTARNWEEKSAEKDYPGLRELQEFLHKRAGMLDVLSANVTQSETSSKPRVQRQHTVMAASIISCYYCSAPHSIYKCTAFAELSVGKRFEAVKRLNLCLNCLQRGHRCSECRAPACHICKGKHNRMLHGNSNAAPRTAQASAEVAEAAEATIVSTNMFTARKSHRAYSLGVVPSVRINCFDRQGNAVCCRGVLDSCAQSNFITERLRCKLGIGKRDGEFPISAITDVELRISGACTVKIGSQTGNYTSVIECLVVDEVSQPMPQVELDKRDWEMPRVKLSDETFATPGNVDILLSVNVMSEVLRPGLINVGRNLPIVQDTAFGWVVMGSVPFQSAHKKVNRSCHLVTDDIHSQIAKFWELEEVPIARIPSADEQECEEHFKQTHTRDEDGRFNVSIPFSRPTSLLGDSAAGAKKRFYALESKQTRDNDFRRRYAEFMSEYEALGHMTRVDCDNDKSIPYYIPHHGVLNASSLTTKLRVVFDASFVTTSGYSRNSLERIGPVIQDELINILLRFRQNAIVFCADIEKMYRQVKVHAPDRVLQRVYWRSSPSEALSVYELNTVSYGTASASFLATRCLRQLAKESAAEYGRASEIIDRDMYVDDLLSGADSEDEARELCHQVDTILRRGCFPLRKWVSNVPSVVEGVSGENTSTMNRSLGDDTFTKILGLQWCPANDVLNYQVEISMTSTCTKRSILSAISRVFDPLGLLGCVLIRAKLIIQELWKMQLDWDVRVPEEPSRKWMALCDDLKRLNEVRIPRCILITNYLRIELHGFADASQAAYGACVYVRSISPMGTAVHLLLAKSKVAPTKPVTIPRLELCAALLLAKFIVKTCGALRLTVHNVYLWSDTSIVLSWIRTPTNLLKLFVANRVSKIVEVTRPESWRHVSTTDNPADMISRGIAVGELLHSSLWWHGPQWLTTEEHEWPVSSVPLRELSALPEVKGPAVLSVTVVVTTIDFSRFSNFCRLSRAVAFCIRFIKNCRSSPKDRYIGALAAPELLAAESVIVKAVQAEAFRDELNALKIGRELKRSSRLRSLAPYLDEDGVMRVGGRLQHAEMSHIQKHPAVLPSKHHVTVLLFRHIHLCNLHVGPQQLLFMVRDRYWPLRGIDMAKRTVHACVRCYRAKPKNSIPFLGALPAPRVNPSFPFMHTGVDYAGPFFLVPHRGRGTKLLKGYLSLFVCLATKAIHLEMVNNLSTESFIACLRRFIARRGRPHAIHSDNATNFVGANNELKRIVQSLEGAAQRIQAELAGEGILWNFIPPQAPHFGGLWESNIRRVKHHLKRVIGSESLTYEEFATVTCQIESLLNSRPLCPLSENPNDYQSLTPAHFLIGRPMTSLLEPAELQAAPISRLSRFERLQRMVQAFWQRWKAEYLNTLQQRAKHNSPVESLRVGQLAIIQEDHAPSLQWRMGRIEAVHPGEDGVVRVVTLKTATGAFKRPARKVYPLPASTLSDNEISTAKIV